MKTGVCIVRVETQSENLLIAVSARRDIDRSLHSAFEERPRYFTEPDDALAAITQFLYSFRGTDPTEGKPADRHVGK
ncbi:MAG: hypothetical protein M3021_12380 [Actinomycetota bacterium]|nr:hypothetical protein [Actinomycetota bacterium]